MSKAAQVPPTDDTTTHTPANDTNATDAMNDETSADRMTRNLTRAAGHYQDLMGRYLSSANPSDNSEFLQDQLHVSAAFMEMFANMFSEPESLLKFQLSMIDDYWSLYQSSMQRFWGSEAEPLVQPDAKDRRFKDPAWEEHPGFDFLKQFYLMASSRIQNAVGQVKGLDPKTAQKVSFYTQQFIDALSPSNFLFTNPQALRETLETDGENLVRGMENLLEDVAAGRISMTDVQAFEVGKNIACTPGQVVFQNDLMQLIQYAPTTEKVHKTPLLIIPAWINKFYILDLKPENSMVKWLVDQGYTVFMVSWVNPDDQHREKTFDDYMLEGPVAALDAIEKQTGEKQIGAIGYCLGGTLLSITQAYLAKQGKADRIASSTYFTTMTDFSEAGEISVFIDEEQLGNLERRMSRTGYLEGKDMALTFNMLRANDLIWHFYVNNYLLGKAPFPFDLLYWNSDATRMPAKMHGFYMRNMYQKNLLMKAGGITIADTPIDLRAIKTPTYMISTREDHIAPWESTYKGTQLFGGETRFVLADSGHVAGIINPPVKKKYCYWSHNVKNPANPKDWLKEAKQEAGSWWPDWAKWNAQFAGEQVAARDPLKGPLKALEAAPGSYVESRV